MENYVADWISIATPVAQAAGLHSDGTVSFQGASFAGQGFTPTEIFNLGILDSVPGKLISVYVSGKSELVAAVHVFHDTASPSIDTRQPFATAEIFHSFRS